MLLGLLLGTLLCEGLLALLAYVLVALLSGVIDELLAELLEYGLLGYVEHFGALLDIYLASESVVDLGDRGDYDL